jgi:AcrR family transcriptional regulator
VVILELRERDRSVGLLQALPWKRAMMNSKDQTVKERILGASIKLFLANGFRGTSVKELTDAVGVAKGTLYWHFSSKDEILDSILSVFE